MSYELSFAPEFFLAEGEPYDRSTLALNADGKPISVYSALRMMDEAQWLAACRDAFPKADPKLVDCEMMLARVHEINTCRNLHSPVEVYLDSEGWSRVLVYEGPEAEPKPEPTKLVLRIDNLEPREGCAMVTLSGRQALVFAKHQQSVGDCSWEGSHEDDGQFAYALPTDGAELVREIRALEGEHSIDGWSTFVVEVNWDEYCEGADDE